MKRYAMWSGGKDSSATIGLCYEMGIELDGVVMSEIMFDKKRGISAEHPLHINWVYDEGIPNIEKLGYKVIVLRGEKDYKAHFYGVIEQSKYPERIGKKHGFVMGGNRCSLKRDCKIRVIDKWCKQQGEFEKIVGIAIDEEERLAALYKEPNTRSILAERKIREIQTYGIAEKYGLLSPFYGGGYDRQGCWFCPNCSIEEFADTARDYPELWHELEIMAQEPDLVSPCFKYDKTFEQINKQVCAINEIRKNQINIFDYLKELGL